MPWISHIKNYKNPRLLISWPDQEGISEVATRAADLKLIRCGFANQQSHLLALWLWVKTYMWNDSQWCKVEQVVYCNKNTWTKRWAYKSSPHFVQPAMFLARLYYPKKGQFWSSQRRFLWSITRRSTSLQFAQEIQMCWQQPDEAPLYVLVSVPSFMGWG